jgi:uncharacterized protein (DUF2235 family)
MTQRSRFTRRDFLKASIAAGHGDSAPAGLNAQDANPALQIEIKEGRSKRIVICADGTWNEPERDDPTTGRPQPTNVLKVARAILPRSGDGTQQVVYYHKGVGTAGGLDEVTGGAFGEGLEVNVRSMYRFLSHNYVPGDEIFLFGFSRGAFTVRTLCGFLDAAYLLRKDAEYFMPRVYEMYRRKQITDYEALHREIPKAYPEVNPYTKVPIKFLGVWDTVGALWPPGFLGQVFGGHRNEYHQIGLNDRIQNAYHALAIDERRRPFKPSVFERPSGWTGELQQAWFAGVHSNVGGSYHPDGLANEALHWMVEKAEGHGLEFDQRQLAHYTPCFNSTKNDSMTLMYRLFGNGERAIGEHLSDGEMIHQSALDRLEKEPCKGGYRPNNLLKFLEDHPKPPVAVTNRISRGQACHPLDAPTEPPDCPAE